MTFEFDNIGQVIARLQALQSIHKELLENQTALEKERERTKQELTQYINKQRTVLLHCNNQLHQQQTQLDSICFEAYKWVKIHTHIFTEGECVNVHSQKDTQMSRWHLCLLYCLQITFCTKITDYSCILQELKLKHFCSTAEKEILYFAQLKTTIHNIYQMITHYNRRVSVDSEDTFKQLEMVNNVLFVKYFVVDVFFIKMRYRKSHHSIV